MKEDSTTDPKTLAIIKADFLASRRKPLLGIKWISLADILRKMGGN